MVALSKRSSRLNSLKSLMSEVPKINKSTQELEKSALEAQHAYMTGVNQIATQKLKLDIDGAHMQSEQQKTYQKGMEKLSLDAVEMSTNLMRNYTKITGLFNEILMARIDNIWENIKRLTRGFKF
jgi:outer membrane PBP1 activator LpoA protein